MIKEHKYNNPPNNPQDLKILFEGIFNRCPELKKGKSVLQVGARPGGGWVKLFQGFKKSHYNRFDVLEIWKPNCDRLKWKFLNKVICGDVRNVQEIVSENKKYDVIVFWHGVEHLSKDEGNSVIAKLESRAKIAVVLGMPYGEWKRAKLTYNNPNEAHISAWYPKDLEKLDFTEIHSIGPPDVSKGLLVGVKMVKNG